jgi:hypothetical protein
MLPELQTESAGDGSLRSEFSSADDVMSLEETHALLERNRLLLADADLAPVPSFVHSQGHELLR